MYNKPHINVLETPTDINITANKIIDDFSSDENTANTKYLDKIIEVKGLITSTKIDKEKGIVILHTNDDFGSVLCHLSKDSTQKISSLKEGQLISVKGICTGFLMDVVLVKCEIIN
jgi:DNA/RNA endonuclease YhcR with UshA esterase domain